MIALADIVGGDGSMLLCYKLTCSYKILRVLPFCLSSGGAAVLEDTLETRVKVDAAITGLATWERSFVLICDIHGLLIELEPMTIADWEKIRHEFSSTTMEPYFCNLGVFNEDHPSIRPKTQTKSSKEERLVEHAVSQRRKQEAADEIVVQNL
eukprot:CAMPEP_0170650748 /NCGR_PEP_ID=MMETSP0224-20130122/45981_1 /TAXON_ID=285029 /ORGANISM="Togula jolla, Strain CCCM 725" /LENGTH=152 /DNA_ID=CAMNT_0010982457 /DNA_START=68 /DNA_END=527 /DNA_ORIENTATION=-